MTFAKRINDDEGPVNGNAESTEELMGMEAAVELITPTIATQLLNEKSPNRTIRQGHTDRLRRALNTKTWFVTSQGIGVDRNGHCVDGQHRLTAIVRTGVSVWTPVVRGLDPMCFPVIDDGRKRSLGDDYKKEDKPDYAARAAFHRLAYQFEYAAKKDLKLSLTRTLQVNRMEVMEAGERYDTSEDTTAIIRAGNHASKKYAVPASSFNAAYFLALQYKAQEDTANIHRFFEQISTGFHIVPGDPAAAIHNTINQLRSSTASRTGVDTTEALAAMLYMLGKHLSGEKISRVTWSAVRRKTPRELLS